MPNFALRDALGVRVISQHRAVNPMALVASDHRCRLLVPIPAALAVWNVACSPLPAALGGDPAFATLFGVLRSVLRVLVTL